MMEPLVLPELWDVQDTAVRRLRDHIRARSDVWAILSMPTGSGKTEVAKYMIGSSYLRGFRSLFAVDRLSLLTQTSRRFYENNIPHGIIGGSADRGIFEHVQIGTEQAIAARGALPPVDVVFVDEAHTVYEKFLDLVRAAKVPVVGLTATPMVPGLGKRYHELVSVTTTDTLIGDGRLAPTITKAAIEIDMSDAPVNSMGEWAAIEVEKRGRLIIGDIITTWVEETGRHFGGPVKTMLFSATIAHGEELCREFRAAGYDARQVTAYDNRDTRDATLEAFDVGEFPIVCSVDALAKGVDFPDVLCLIIARPYRRAFAAHIQMLGRIMRTAPGKEFGLVLDHCVAADQRVLTKRGLVSICSVRNDDLLWDGVEWVQHGGAVRVGTREVMTYAGLTATGDHKVWTRRGWRTLREAAESLDDIAQTGVDGTPVRFGAGHFRGGRIPRAGWRSHVARALRVRDMRLPFDHRAFQSPAWAHEGLPVVQPAAAGISEVAAPTMHGGEGAVHEPARSWLSALWWTWRRISIRDPESDGVVDHRQFRVAGRSEFGRTGPDRERRTLRTRQPAVGVERVEQEQYPTRRAGGEHAPVQTRVPRSAVRRFHALQAHLAGFVGRGNHRTVEPAVVQAEREVWDIRDAGPRNRFTCEGLLTHNSGNVLGFHADTMDFFANGVDKLDDGRFAKSKRADKPPTEAKCPKCDYLHGGANPCPVCGHERARRNEIETVAGEMIHVEAISKGKRPWNGTPAELWTACCTDAARFLERHGDRERARRRAAAKFYELAGAWPPREFTWTPGTYVPKAIQRAIAKSDREYRKRRAAG